MVLLRFVGVTQHGTGKRNEVGLRAAERLLAAIVDSSDDAIVSTSLEGRVQTWNAGAERLFGYTAHEAVGRPISFMGSDAAAEEERRIDQRLQAGERVEQLETVRMRSDGLPIHVSLTVTPLRDDSGAVVGASRIVRDLTDRVRLERKTREQAAALAELDRRKDEFLAMLSHEIRNPLAPIANAVQLLRLEPSESAVEQQARTIIERQVARLSHLVDDLFEVSRVTSGSYQLHLQELALNDVVVRAGERVSTLVDERRHQLTLTLPQRSPWLCADAARLEQVVVHLLTNAIKYTPERGRIEVVVEEERGDGVVRVRDSGVGIAPELLPRIFDLFTQSERSLDRSEGGLGVGLSLVRRLVELHDGTVEARSALGRGSEFVVRIPAIEVPDSVEFASRSPIRLPAKQLRVLVVDDNVDAASSLAMLLRTEGHHIRTTHDGRAALRAARELRPDIVFLDLGLPGLDGFEVARAMRRDPALDHTLLVAMTAYGESADRQRSLDAGFDHHLMKPAEFARLRQILDSVAAAPRQRG